MRSGAISTMVVFAAFASQATANPGTCSFGELTRKIEVVYSNPGQPVPCEVIYDKSAEGSIATLWRANNEAGYCEAQAAGLVEKLSGMGWQCVAETGGAAGAAEAVGESALQ